MQPAKSGHLGHRCRAGQEVGRRRCTQVRSAPENETPSAMVRERDLRSAGVWRSSHPAERAGDGTAGVDPRTRHHRTSFLARTRSQRSQAKPDLEPHSPPLALHAMTLSGASRRAGDCRLVRCHLTFGVVRCRSMSSLTAMPPQRDCSLRECRSILHHQGPRPEFGRQPVKATMTRRLGVG